MAAGWFNVACVFISIVLCAASDDYEGMSDHGVQEPECLVKYYESHKKLPPRHYKYFHENKYPEQQGTSTGDNNTVVPLQWRIVGGKQISISDVPYQVLYGKFCGGSLIAPEWVITAAHCKFDETYVYAGSSLRSDTVPYKICAHIAHPKWDDIDKLHRHDYDYQLVLLENPIPVNHLGRPIAIGSVDDIKPETLVSISGWGYLKYGTNEMSNNLRRIYVPIIPNETCKSVPNENYHTITTRMFCAGLLEGKKDSCQGDSGGPAVVNDKLVGLVSFGVGCAMKRQPGVYSNIPMMRSWIRDVTKLPL